MMAPGRHNAGTTPDQMALLECLAKVTAYYNSLPDTTARQEKQVVFTRGGREERISLNAAVDRLRDLTQLPETDYLQHMTGMNRAIVAAMQAEAQKSSAQTQAIIAEAARWNHVNLTKNTGARNTYMTLKDDNRVMVFGRDSHDIMKNLRALSRKFTEANPGQCLLINGQYRLPEKKGIKGFFQRTWHNLKDAAIESERC